MNKRWSEKNLKTGDDKGVENIEHKLTVRSGLGLSAAIQATAIFVDGFLEKGGVGESTFLFEFREGIEILARPRHPNSDIPRPRAWTPLYNLMAGFFKAGADVTVEGPWASLLPGGGQLLHGADRPSLAIRPIFQDHLAVQSPPIEPAELSKVFHDRERIAAYTPASARLMLDYFGDGPRPVRTWGEAWIGLWSSARCNGLEALNILPNEIAIVHDVNISRYAIADPTTLDDLSTLTFGPGVSTYLSAELWISLAGACETKGAYEMAVRCAEQAVLLDSSKAGELEYYREWLALQTEPQAPVASPVVVPRSIQDLLERLRRGTVTHLEEILADLRMEREDAESYRRQPHSPRSRTLGQEADRVGLSYPEVTGKDFLAAGLSPNHLEYLGHSANPIPPPARYSDVFTIRAEKHTLWGTADRPYLLEKTTVYNY